MGMNSVQIIFILKLRMIFSVKAKIYLGWYNFYIATSFVADVFILA